MSPLSSAHPLPAPALRPNDVLDLYFLETRAKLLEIAATLDRLDRAHAGIPPGEQLPSSDERLSFIRKSLQILLSAEQGRAEQIQRLYSKE